MNVFVRLVDAVTEKLGGAVSLIILPIMIMGCFEVVSRYVFNSPTSWVWAVDSHLFGVLILFGGGYAALHGNHIRIEVLYDRFGPRMRLVSEVLSLVCLLLFLGILLWQGYLMAEMSAGNREILRGTFHLPIYPLKILIPVAVFMFILQEAANFRRELGGMRPQRVTK